MSQLLVLNEYIWDRRHNTAFYIFIGVSGIIISILLYRNVLFSPVIMLFAGKIKKFVTQKIIDRRQRDYLFQFKDFLFMASTGIGSGRSMKDSIGESIPGLSDIYGEKGILVGELKKVYERMTVGGENDVEVLMDMAVSSGLEDCMDFVTVYSICKKTGANLIVALNKATAVIIEKMTVEREIEELVRRKESEGMVILIMPIAVIMFLNLCAYDYIAPMYETVAGRVIMTGLLCGNIAIYGMIQKIINVKI